jgi:stage IV sporulation protein FB
MLIIAKADNFVFMDVLNEVDLNSTVPPKPPVEEKNRNVLVKSISSLILYLFIGYFFFGHNWTILLILTAVVLVHELGHFLAMKAYHYNELGIFFIPLVGAYASGTKKEVSQKQSAVIILAGPVPGIIAGIAIYLLRKYQLGSEFYFMQYDIWIVTAKLLVFLNLLNLLPVYPLDGGQLLNRLFLDESEWLSKIFLVLSALALAYFAIKIQFYPLLLFPLLMIVRMVTDNKYDNVSKLIQEKGIALDKYYEELTDEEYWAIRNILIESKLLNSKSIYPAPPYEYSPDEDKVVSTIENILERTVIQDLNLFSRILIIILCLGCFALPFLLHMPLPFFFAS